METILYEKTVSRPPQSGRRLTLMPFDPSLESDKFTLDLNTIYPGAIDKGTHIEHPSLTTPMCPSRLLQNNVVCLHVARVLSSVYTRSIFPHSYKEILFSAQVYLYEHNISCPGQAPHTRASSPCLECLAHNTDQLNIWHPWIGKKTASKSEAATRFLHVHTGTDCRSCRITTERALTILFMERSLAEVPSCPTWPSAQVNSSYCFQSDRPCELPAFLFLNSDILYNSSNDIRRYMWDLRNCHRHTSDMPTDPELLPYPSSEFVKQAPEQALKESLPFTDPLSAKSDTDWQDTQADLQSFLEIEIPGLEDPPFGRTEISPQTPE